MDDTSLITQRMHLISLTIIKTLLLLIHSRWLIMPSREGRRGSRVEKKAGKGDKHLVLPFDFQNLHHTRQSTWALLRSREYSVSNSKGSLMSGFWKVSVGKWK